jgi:hypothetical protein
MMYPESFFNSMDASSEPSRVCNTKQQLEELIMDITLHDLNHQMQRLVADYKKTGDEHYLEDAAYLRSEFDTWWNDEVSLFAPPAQAV